MKLKGNFDLENGEGEKRGDIVRKLERIGGNERFGEFGGGYFPKRQKTGQSEGNPRKTGGRRNPEILESLANARKWTKNSENQRE